MSVIVNTPHLDALASDDGSRKRQEEYAMRCALLVRDYVPMEEGALRGSEPTSSRYAEGQLIWSTSYAAKQYYVPMNHSRSGTTDHWDEACARDHKKDLIEYAKKMLTEG